jgi:signal transduction histidine kinase
VVLRGDVDALAVDVVNGAAGRAPALDGAGTGNGLRGLRERVDGCGGGFEAGPAGDGGWRVAARLPRRAVATRA